MEFSRLSSLSSYSEEQLLSLSLTASESFDGFVYGSSELAQPVAQALFRAGVSEIDPGHTAVCVKSDRIVGFAAGLPHPEILRRRMRSVAVVLNSHSVREDPDLLERMRAASATLTRTQPNDFYLSRLAVLSSHRGQGIASSLLELVIEDARSTPSSAIRLDVAADAAAAIRLYRRYHFCCTGKSVASNPCTDTTLSHLHFSLFL